MRILITGYSGMIGSRVVKGLTAQGHEVAGIDNYSVGIRNENNEGVKKYILDIRSKDKLNQVFGLFKPNIVIHLAAVHHIPTCEILRTYSQEVNIIGTENILDCCKANYVNKVFIASSGAIYDWKDGLLSEEDPIKPYDNYSICKFTNEYQLKAFAYNNRNKICCAFRIFNTIAYDDPNAHLIPDIISQIDFKQKKQTINLGNTNSLRDYCHADDIAYAIVKIILSKNISSNVYNLASAKGNTAEDIVNNIAMIRKIKININLDKSKMRKIDRPSQIGNNGLIMKEFDKINFRSLEESISEILSHL